MDQHEDFVQSRNAVQSADDGWLDRALEDSFPASDPIALRRFD